MLIGTNFGTFSKKLNGTISSAFIPCTLSPCPKVICYNSLISASGKGSEWSWALHFFQELSRSGLGRPGLLPFLHIRPFWVSFIYRWWFHDSMTDLFVAFGKKFFDLQPSIIGGWPDVQSSYLYGQCQHVPMCGDTPKSSVILVHENSNTLNMLLRIHCFGLMNWVKLWRADILSWNFNQNQMQRLPYVDMCVVILSQRPFSCCSIQVL